MGANLSNLIWSVDEKTTKKKKKKYYVPVYKRKEIRYNPETAADYPNILDIQVDKVK